MRSIIAPVALGILASLLASCSKPDYLRESEVTAPIRTAPGIPLKPTQTYYPIPNTSVSPRSGAATSQVPPGSDLERFESSSNNQSANPQTPVQSTAAPALAAETSNATTPEAPTPANTQPNIGSGSQSISLNGNVTSTWDQVGKALGKTAYQVLDQDQSVYSYFILDKYSTENKITRSTPIYRVHLKAEGSKTEVVLLDQTNQPAPDNVASRILGAVKHGLE